MPEQPPQRFKPRTEPYDPATQAKLIRNSHCRRDRRLAVELAKMDQVHPGSYGLTFISPEIGFGRVNVSGLLTGFDDTPFFSQLLADMATYVRAQDGNHRFTTEERLLAIPCTTIRALVDAYRGTSYTRDALRLFLTSLAVQDGYDPLWKASNLTLPVMKAELCAIAVSPNIKSEVIWQVLVRISSRIKRKDDILYVVQLLDAISRQRGEELQPQYPFEHNPAIQEQSDMTALLDVSLPAGDLSPVA